MTPSRSGRIGHHVLWGAADHLARLGADRFDAVVLGVESDDRRLVQDDAASGDEDAGVGRAEIDGEIGREAEDITEKH